MHYSDATMTRPSLDFEVAVVSKPGSPRILNKPVVLSMLGTISNYSDLMVEIVLAV